MQKLFLRRVMVIIDVTQLDQLWQIAPKRYRPKCSEPAKRGKKKNAHNKMNRVRMGEDEKWQGSKTQFTIY